MFDFNYEDLTGRNLLVRYIGDFMPLMHRKFFKKIHTPDLPKMQMVHLKNVSHEDGMPISYFGEKLMISKPNMSKLTTKMINDGLLEAKNDPSDKRVTKLNITESGKTKLHEAFKVVSENLLDILSRLEDEDVERLNINFCEIKEILKKIDE